MIHCMARPWWLPILALLLAGSAKAPPHDTWLLVMDQAAGRGLSLSLRTGMDFPQSENAVLPERVSCRLLDGKGEPRAVTGWRVDDATKSTIADLGQLAAGGYVAAVDTQPRELAMKATEFNLYLLHDGLQQVLYERLETGQDQRPSTERYRKCAKVIFGVGGAVDVAFDKPLGQRLEIVPLDHPLRLKPRGTLAVRILFDGKPLPHANVGWDHPGNGHDVAGTTWSDANGEALVPIARAGWMTVRLVHMTHPGARDYEWESFWGSLSFEVPAAPR
jgi:hypothetical protein